MNYRFLIIVLFLLSRLISNGQEKEHLLPLRADIDNPDIIIKYDQAIRNRLVKDYEIRHKMLARVVIEASLILPFSWQINQLIKNDTTYSLVYRQSTVDIWHNISNYIDVSDSDIKTIRVKIQKEDALLIGELFRLALLTTRHQEPEEEVVTFGEALTFLYSREVMTSYSERLGETNSYTDRVTELENICLEIKKSLENFSPQEVYRLPIEQKEKIKILIERFKK